METHSLIESYDLEISRAYDFDFSSLSSNHTGRAEMYVQYRHIVYGGFAFTFVSRCSMDELHTRHASHWWWGVLCMAVFEQRSRVCVLNCSR